MTARRIKDSWWVDFRCDGERHRKKSPINTKRGAEEFERLLRSRLVNGEPLDGKGSTPVYEAFVGEWLETYVVANNKPSEVESKRCILRRHLIPFFGNLRVQEIGVREIERFKAAKVSEGLSPKRINNCLTVLRRSLVSAQDWDVLESIPSFQWMKTPEPGFDHFSAAEGARLLGAARGLDYVMLFTALRTGLRRGELMALRWEDVDLKASKLFVRRNVWRGQITTPKNGRMREVPLSPEAVRVLRGHRHMRSELVFCNEDGSMVGRKKMRNIVPRVCRRAGLRRVQWHVLRHSFASQLVLAGVPLKAVQELLGHRDIKMTMRYAHMAPSALSDAVSKLDDAANSGHYMGTAQRLK